MIQVDVRPLAPFRPRHITKKAFHRTSACLGDVQKPEDAASLRVGVRRRGFSEGSTPKTRQILAQALRRRVLCLVHRDGESSFCGRRMEVLEDLDHGLDRVGLRVQLDDPRRRGEGDDPGTNFVDPFKKTQVTTREARSLKNITAIQIYS